MITDIQNSFTYASRDFSQAITASAASANVIDLGDTRDKGPGEPIQIAASVTEDFATLTSLQVSVQTSTDAAFSSPTTLIQTAAVPLASLTAGYRFTIDKLPEHCDRYVRLYFTVAGTNATAGSVAAGVVVDRESI